VITVVFKLFLCHILILDIVFKYKMRKKNEKFINRERYKREKRNTRESPSKSGGQLKIYLCKKLTVTYPIQLMFTLFIKSCEVYEIYNLLI